LCWLHFRNGRLILSSLGGSEDFLPVERSRFRLVPKKYPPEPIATLELLTPNAEGLFIQAGFGNTLKRVPGWFAVGEIVVTIFVLLSILSILVYAPFWIFGGLSRKRRRPAERGMRIWPLAAVLSLAAFVAIVILCKHDLIERMGNLTVWSALLFLSTIAFALTTIASTIAWWRTPAQAARRSVRRFSAIVTVALMIAAAYLAYWGIIGLRTWA
jgi:hypothetical protein